jgi:hypothetical protein
MEQIFGKEQQTKSKPAFHTTKIMDQNNLYMKRAKRLINLIDGKIVSDKSRKSGK